MNIYSKLFIAVASAAMLCGCIAKQPDSSVEPSTPEEPSSSVVANDGLTPETAFTFSEAAEKMDALGDKVVSDEMYYVKGEVTTSTYSSKYGSYTLNCTFEDTKNFVFYSVSINTSDDYSAENALAGKTVMGYGYLELYGEKYEMPYLSAKYSPTGSAFTPTVTIIK